MDLPSFMFFYLPRNNSKNSAAVCILHTEGDLKKKKSRGILEWKSKWFLLRWYKFIIVVTTGGLMFLIATSFSGTEARPWGTLKQNTVVCVRIRIVPVSG